MNLDLPVKTNDNIDRKGTQIFPELFLRRMTDILGSDYVEFYKSLHLPASVGLRVNSLKISPDEFLQISPNKLSPVPWCSSGYIVEDLIVNSENVPPGKHPYHAAGLFYIQEPSAMAAAEALAPLPGEKVLDLAAAPGGKTTHLACLMKNTGLLVANEIHPKRVWDLVENLERCGVTNAIVTNETPERLASNFVDYFDRVLLDAPCSGEGMFRKSETARKEWKPEMPHSCALRQFTILEQAAIMVKPGGCLAYTTCTFSPEENEGVIASFLSKHPDFDIKPIDHRAGLDLSRPEWIGLPQDQQISKAVRIWPHRSPGEGHFIALLVKNRGLNPNWKEKSSRSAPPVRTRRNKQKLTSMSILDDFSRTNLNLLFEREQLLQSGSYVYKSPGNPPQNTRLKIIHPGWWIGSIRNERFIPSHALAMGIQARDSRQALALQTGDERVFIYLRGGSFADLGVDGWVLITLDGYPLGWGKRVQNVIKNHYPRGLRQSPEYKH